MNESDQNLLGVKETGDEARLKKRRQRAELGPSKDIVKFLEEYRGEFKEGDHALELGVGEGRNLEAFQDLNLNLHGIELDPEGVKICREQLTKKDIKADIREGSFTDLSEFDNESMKLVYSQYAVQNARTMKEIHKVFSEIRRVLEEGGLYLFREQRHPLLKDADRRNRVAYFTEQEMQELAEQYGFDIMEGETPVETKDDPRRVGGKQAVWNLIFRKK